MIIEVDLAQIEWRIEAALTGDPVMIKEINDGVDIHALNCTSVLHLPFTDSNRTDTKIFTFRAIYAEKEIAPYAYWKDSTMPDFSKKKWQEIVTAFFQKYEVMARGRESWVYEVRRNGGYLGGPTGRIWHFNKQRIRRGGGSYEDYSRSQIYNYKNQGTSGDVIKFAINKAVGNGANLVLPSYFTNTVHDSHIYDCGCPNCLDACRKGQEAWGGSFALECETIKVLVHVFQNLRDDVSNYYDWDIPVHLGAEIKRGPSWGQMEKVIKW